MLVDEIFSNRSRLSSMYERITWAVIELTWEFQCYRSPRLALIRPLTTTLNAVEFDFIILSMTSLLRSIRARSAA